MTSDQIVNADKPEPQVAAAPFAMDRTAMSEAYWQVWNDEVQAKIDADIEKYRKADAVFAVSAPDGAEVKIEQLSHDFLFGAHIFNFNQLGRKEWNDRYKALYGAENALFNSATVAFYWRTLEVYPSSPRFEERYEDTETFWNNCPDPMGQPHWRRPAVDPVVSFLKTRRCHIHGHPLVWGNNEGMFPTWLWDDFCPESEKTALEQASGVRIPSRDISLPMGAKNMATGDRLWSEAWAKIYARLPEEEIARLVPTFLRAQRDFYEKRIRDIAARYGSRVDSWDVVNESATDYDRFGRRAVREKAFDASWYGPMPADYAFNAFAWCQKYLPATARFDINEYDMGPFFDQVEDLTANGARIDVVGSQMHLFNPADSTSISRGEFTEETYAKTHPEGISKRFEILAKAGKPIHLSEITIAAPDPSPRGEMVQAILARNLYRAWFSTEKINGITWWNVVDGCGFPGEPSTSGLFTRDMRPKTAYWALENLVNHQWKTNLVVAAKGGKVSFRGFRGKYRISWRCDKCGEMHSRLVWLNGDGVAETLEAKVPFDCLLPVRNYRVDGTPVTLSNGEKYVDLKALYPTAVVRGQGGTRWADVETTLIAPADGEYDVFRYNDYWGEVFVNGESIGTFHGPEIFPALTRLRLRKGANVVRHRTRAGTGGAWKCGFLLPGNSPLGTDSGI